MNDYPEWWQVINGIGVLYLIAYRVTDGWRRWWPWKRDDAI